MKIFIIIAVTFFLNKPCNAEIIDGLAARVGDRIITIKEVITEYKIAYILQQRKKTVRNLPAASFSRDTLDQMINRELIYREAINAKSFSEQVDIFEEMIGFEEKFSNSEVFNSFMNREGLSADHLADRFLKISVGSTYLAEKLPHMVSVSLKEIENYYKMKTDLFSDKKIQDVEEQIRRYLLEKKRANSIDKLISSLRKQADIFYFKLPPL